MCDNDLKAKTDFNWTSSRTTYSTDWGFYCGQETKSSLVSSVYYIGCVAGMLSSTAIFDQVGRKRGALIGGVITAVSVVVTVFAPNFEVLLIFRIITGFGQIIHYIGSYCWVLELTPKSFRNLVSATWRLNWTASHFLLIGLSYLLLNWRHIFIAVAVISIVALVPLLVLPESPRFQLIRGMEKEAKKTLQSLSSISGNRISLDKINLIYEVRVQNYMEQVKDYMIYPTLRRDTILVVFSWFMIAIVTCGYVYTWAKIGDDIYTSYSIAVLGEAIAFIGSVPICNLFGRKRTMLFFIAGTIASNFVAMIDLKLSDSWSLEHIASVVGFMFTSSAFMLMYLIIIERFPTSHSGMVFSLANVGARSGCFLGPQVNLLYGVTSRRVPQALYAGVGALAFVGMAFIPDTTGKPIPQIPGDMEVNGCGKVRDGEKGMEETNNTDMVYKNPGTVE